MTTMDLDGSPNCFQRCLTTFSVSLGVYVYREALDYKVSSFGLTH